MTFHPKTLDDLGTRPPHYTQCQWANRQINRAVYYGLLVWLEHCQECGRYCLVDHNGRNAIHVHHVNYARPFDVRGLCRSCHRQWHCDHLEMRFALNAHTLAVLYVKVLKRSKQRDGKRKRGA